MMFIKYVKYPMKALIINLLSVLCAIGSPLFAGQKAGASLPNIVFIFVDDMGVGDVGHYHDYFIDQGLVTNTHFNYSGTTPETVIRTPNMNRICEEGMIFTDAQLPASLCAPNRFCVLTGNNTVRSREFGTWGHTESSGLNYASSRGGLSSKPMTYEVNGKSISVLDSNGNIANGSLNGFGDRRNNPHDTLGDILVSAGYHTAFFGKMHIGGDFYDWGGDVLRYNFFNNNPNAYDAYDFTRKFDQGMTDHGFDYTFVSPDGIQGKLYMYFENDLYKPISDFDQDIENWWPGSMNPNALGNTSILRYFEATRYNNTNLNNPVTGVFSANSVYDDKNRLITSAGTSELVNDYGELLAKGFGDSRFDTSEHGPVLAYHAVKYIESRVATSPDQPFMLFYAAPAIHTPITPSLHARGSTGLGPRCDFVVDLDQQIGKILDSLDALGISDNTLIILSSDNGGTLANKARLETSNRQHPSGPLRGTKSSIYEGGHRVPFAFKWGDGSPDGSVIMPGTVCNHHVSIIDVAASLIDLTGQAITSDQHQDSISLLPFLMSETPDSIDPIRKQHFYLINKSILNQSVRYDENGNQWVFIFDEDGSDLELYNLAIDPGQENNLINGYSTVADVPSSNYYKSILETMNEWYHTHDSALSSRSQPAIDFDADGVVETISSTSDIISANFTSKPFDDTQIDSDENYGISSLGTLTGNWENLSTSKNNLISDSGTATTVDLTLSGDFLWSNSAYNDTPMRHGLFNSQADQTTVTLSNLNTTFPDGCIVVTYLAGFTDNSKASISDGNNIYYFQTMASPVAPINLQQTTDTILSDPTPEAQFAVFGSTSNLITNDSITLSLTKISGGSVTIGGIQIYGGGQYSVINNNKTTLSVPTRDVVLEVNSYLSKLEYSNLESGLTYSTETSTNLSTSWNPLSSFEIEVGSTRTEDYDATGAQRFFKVQYPAKINKRSLPLNSQ